MTSTLGAVHKVRHAILGQFVPLLPPCHTLSHKKSVQKPPVQILYQLFAGFLSGIVCQRVYGLEGFVRGGFCPFLVLSQYICYNRKLNITLNFMFNMYDKKRYKRDVTCA